MSGIRFSAYVQEPRRKLPEWEDRFENAVRRSNEIAEGN